MRGRMLVIGGVMAAGMACGMVGAEDRVEVGVATTKGVAASQARAEEVAEISKAVVDVTKLKDWGTKEYSFGKYRDGVFVELGTFTVKTTLEKDEVVFDDVIEMTKGGAVDKRKLHGVMEKNGALGLKSMLAEISGMRGEGTVSIEVKDGQATMKSTEAGKEEEVKKMAFDANTVTTFGLMRLVTILPREGGKQWWVSSMFNEFKMSQRGMGAGVLTCAGEQKVEIENKEEMMTQFLYTEKDTVKAEMLVDKDGVLREMVFGGREILRLKKEEGK